MKRLSIDSILLFSLPFTLFGCVMEFNAELPAASQIISEPTFLSKESGWTYSGDSTQVGPYADQNLDSIGSIPVESNYNEIDYDVFRSRNSPMGGSRFVVNKNISWRVAPIVFLRADELYLEGDHKISVSGNEHTSSEWVSTGVHGGGGASGGGGIGHLDGKGGDGGSYGQNGRVGISSLCEPPLCIGGYDGRGSGLLSSQLKGYDFGLAGDGGAGKSWGAGGGQGGLGGNALGGGGGGSDWKLDGDLADRKIQSGAGGGGGGLIVLVANSISGPGKLTLEAKGADGARGHKGFLRGGGGGGGVIFVALRKYSAGQLKLDPQLNTAGGRGHRDGLNGSIQFYEIREYDDGSFRLVGPRNPKTDSWDNLQ